MERLWANEKEMNSSKSDTNICTRSTVPKTLMEVFLGPGDCIRGVFGVIWVSGGGSQ